MLSEFVVVVPERFGWEFGGLATPNGAACLRVRLDLHVVLLGGKTWGICDALW